MNHLYVIKYNGALFVPLLTHECSFFSFKARNFRDKMKADVTQGPSFSHLRAHTGAGTHIGKAWSANETGSDTPSLINESLADKCIKIVVANFANYPVHENIPARSVPCLLTSRYVNRTSV